MAWVRPFSVFAALAMAFAASLWSPATYAAVDRDGGRFSTCHGGHRVNCVVDGDTFWYLRRAARAKQRLVQRPRGG